MLSRSPVTKLLILPMRLLVVLFPAASSPVWGCSSEESTSAFKRILREWSNARAVIRASVRTTTPLCRGRNHQSAILAIDGLAYRNEGIELHEEGVDHRSERYPKNPDPRFHDSSLGRDILLVLKVTREVWWSDISTC